MKPGDRIYYTGDMANGESAGTVTRYRPRGKYTPESVDITYDDSRFEGDSQKSRMVPIIAFKPGPGRRFLLLSEHEANRAAAMKQIQERLARTGV